MRSRRQVPFSVCVFAKAPVCGRVKTRLIPTLGPEGATRLARALLRDTVRMVTELPRAVPVMALSGSPDEVDPEVLAPMAHVWDQGDGDLGQRQERALRRSLKRGGPVLLIGSDLPGLPASHLEHAAGILTGGADAVIGPADDGGFYLIGVNRCPKGLLDGLPWSRSKTREKTVERLRDRGLDTRLARPWFDVDEPEDLKRLADALARGRISAPNTAKVIDGFLNKINQL